jgi:hypothetical protein
MFVSVVPDVGGAAPGERGSRMDGRDRPTGQRHLLRYGAVLGLLAAGLISGAPPALAVNGDATTDPALSFVAKVSVGGF